MGRALLAARLALRQSHLARQCRSIAPYRPISQSGPATAQSKSWDRAQAPGINEAVKVLRTEFRSELFGLRSSVKRINHEFVGLSKNQNVLKNMFRELQRDYDHLSTKFGALLDKVTDLSNNYTGVSAELAGLSERLTKQEKIISIIKWEMSAVFLVAFAFVGCVLWMAKHVWDLFAADFGDALSAVIKQYLAISVEKK